MTSALLLPLFDMHASRLKFVNVGLGDTARDHRVEVTMECKNVLSFISLQI
jgi:hypothetical protein